ncbi:hypothetical protein AB0J86_22110 [Micromonospora sp. NPDC049559]|uniref:hypothetical protein n=1 Tax=Micromonospora sp. NPDC049559 TaxID=3155923 RepID=UPI003420C6C4
MTTKGEINVTGDIIRAESGAIVNNRATVTNSFNNLAERYDPGVAEALVKLERAVAESENSEARELLAAFLDALGSERQQPSVLKRLFAGIQEVAPGVAAMTDVVARISSIWS